MGQKLKDEDLLVLMLSGKSQKSIANELQVTEATVSRRVNTEAFSQMLSEYRKRILDGVITDLTAVSRKAVQTLVELLEDENSFVRLNAASKILTIVQEYSIQHDLMKEVEEIKQAQRIYNSY